MYAVLSAFYNTRMKHFILKTNVHRILLHVALSNGMELKKQIQKLLFSMFTELKEKFTHKHLFK